MRKLWAIIWKENYERFTDRTGALFMFLTPLALAIVIGLAFSGLSGTDNVALHIPIGIVNLDTGSNQGAFGEVFVHAIVPETDDNPDPDNPLFELFNAVVYADEAEARALVESGALAAMLVIPPDFSQSLALDPAVYVELATGSEDVILTGQASLTLFYNSGSQLGWTVLRDVAQGIANNIATGNIAINTTVSGLLQANPLLGIQLGSGAFNDTFAEIAMAASDPAASPIRLEQLDIEGETTSFDPMSFFGPGIAIFFAGFTVMLGAASVLQERRDWTLQRMITTPTSRNVILGGKMLGTYIGGVLQMTVLIIAMTLVNSLLQGEFASVYGDDVLGIILVTLATVAAGTGIGVLIAGSARSFEQATNTGSVVMIVMGLLGGVFFAPPPGLEFASQLTFHYWGSGAFTTLATGGVLLDVLPNIAALLIMAAVLFGLGLWQFNRQLSREEQPTMTKLLTITFNDIRLYLQTPANVLQLTIIPLAFVFIMGLALGGDQGTSSVLLDVVNEDGSPAATALVEALAAANPNVIFCPAANDADNACQLDEVDTAALSGEQALARLTDGVTSASLTIPAGYADALATDTETTLVFQSEADMSAPQVALQTVQSVLTRIGGATVAARLSTDAAEERGLLTAEDRPAFYATRYTEAEIAWGPPAPITLEVEATQQSESASGGGDGFGQSAPGMASMFVMMNVLGLGAVLLEERQDGTLPRLLVMPMTRAQILGGKMLRGFLLGLFQFGLMLVFGTLLGVNFGGNVIAVVLIVVSYVLAVTAMAMALATLVRTPDQAFGISLLASMVLAPLGGAWWPLEIVPEFMRTVGHISPIAWCMDAFNTLLYQNGGLADVLLPVLVLLGVAVTCFAFGISRFSYE